VLGRSARSGVALFLVFLFAPPGANGALAVFVMNADGSERRQVTHLSPEEGTGTVAGLVAGRPMARRSSQ
jgi:hypothetical protein